RRQFLLPTPVFAGPLRSVAARRHQCHTKRAVRHLPRRQMSGSLHPYNLQTPPHQHRGKAEGRRCRANTKALPPAQALAAFHTARGKVFLIVFDDSVHRRSNVAGQ
ncbi:hypothetical protein TcCL_NonESM11509, partial [Trypanosoma cruzi]